MDLNNREIAFVAWIGIPAIVLIWKAGAWGLLANVIKALFARKLIPVHLAIAAYVATCVWLLASVDAWAWSDLKSTVMWLVAFPWILAARVVQSGAGSSIKLSTLAKSTLGLAAVIEYVAEFRSFGLVTELVVTPIVLLAV